MGDVGIEKAMIASLDKLGLNLVVSEKALAAPLCLRPRFVGCGSLTRGLRAPYARRRSAGRTH